MRSIVILLWCAGLAGAGDFKFPEAPPVPIPAPNPMTVPTLTADKMYVIEAAKDFISLTSPGGKIKFEVEPGPIKIRGKFVGGPDQYETKTFSAKWVITVVPVAGATGQAEIILVPKGVTEEKDIGRQVVNVNGGSPEPDPTPDPTPNPPKPDLKASKLRVVIVERSQQSTADAGAIYANKELNDYMQLKGHRWRIVTPTIVDTSGQTPSDVRPYIADSATAPLPMIYLEDEATKLRHKQPRPNTPAEVLALLKQWEGK